MKIFYNVVNDVNSAESLQRLYDIIEKAGGEVRVNIPYSQELIDALDEWEKNNGT